MPRTWLFLGLLVVAASGAAQGGCSCAGTPHGHPHTDGSVNPDIDAAILPGVDTGTGSAVDAAGPAPADSGFVRSCAPDSPDLEGCGCQGDAPRACWPYTLDPSYRGVGLCTDGMQQCTAGSEFGVWGPCTGGFFPDAEYCSNMLDDNCDGLTDCADPTCAADPSCQSGCTDGQTRACYTGPARTLGVGACHSGTQTCTGGVWSTPCVGEQLPQAEDCSTPRDLNCNRQPGCFDLFVCASSPACQEHCADPLMPGCVCPMGQGDVATCPRGDFAITTGTIGGTIQCCPCRASDCGNANCCNEAVCAGNAWCGGLNCRTLPASCMGMVNADCDDFPEDCDEPCCECYGDCSGP